MFLSDVSIKRPVFATVMSLLLVVLGIISFSRLSLRELPAIDPPIVSVDVNYPGASAAVVETRITHLAYAPEIAAAMLQRQQASAIIDARKLIVEGAVGMVEMALRKLSENDIVELDDERKAQMVSNLLVVLCGNKDAQPVVNSGSIY